MKAEINYLYQPKNIFLYLTLLLYYHNINAQNHSTVVADTRLNPSKKDTSICKNASQYNLNGSVTNNLEGKWSTSGGGIFSDLHELNGVYTFSEYDKEKSFVTLYLSVYDEETQTSVVDSIQIFFLPKVYVGKDQYFCEGIGSIYLNEAFIESGIKGKWTTSGNGTFYPNDSTLNATYYFSSEENSFYSIYDEHYIYLTLTTNSYINCGNNSSTLLAVISPLAGVSAGEDRTICDNVNSIQLDAYGINVSEGSWTTTGTGYFSSADARLGIYFPSLEDKTNGNSIKFTLEAFSYFPTCNGYVSDDMIVTFKSSATVQTSEDQKLCSSVNSIGISGSITETSPFTWTSSGTGTFEDGKSLNSHYFPSYEDKISGNILLVLGTLETENCANISDTISVNFIGPVVDAGIDQLFLCSEENTIPISGTLTNTNEATWSSSGTGIFEDNKLQNTHYLPSDKDKISGKVSITYSAPPSEDCANISDTASIVFIRPLINAGGDQILCYDEINDHITLHGKINTKNFQWKGTGAFIPSSNSLEAAYYISYDDKKNGSINLVLESQEYIKTCGVISDSMNLVLLDCTTTSFSETFSNTIKIKPNPTNGVLNIESGEKDNFERVKIYNSLGVLQKEINNENQAIITIDIHEFQQGVYLIYLIDKNGDTVIKKNY